LGHELKVTPQELRDAATKIEGLKQRVDQAPMLHGDDVAKGLPNTLIGALLPQLNSDSTSAKDVLRKRLQELANLLRFTADHYHGRDADIAQRLTAITEMNSGQQVGAVQPGLAQPGVTQPGVTQPGVTQPSLGVQPGVTVPGGK
jgi:hypothetical protein